MQQLATRLAQREIDMSVSSDLNGVIEAIYDAGLDARLWPAVYRQIAEQIGAADVNLSLLPRDMPLPAGEWSGIDPDFARAYTQHYSDFDPIIPLAHHWPSGTILTDKMIKPQEAHERSAFYQEWVRPQHIYTIVVATVINEDGVAGILGAIRKLDVPYSTNELDIVAALVPHLRNAIRTQRRVEGLELRENIQCDALDAFTHSIVIVDCHAKVLFANRAAQGLLAAANLLNVTQHRLNGPTPADTRRLHAIIALAASDDGRARAGGAMLIQRAPPDEPLQVLVSPLGRESRVSAAPERQRAAMLVVIDPQSNRRGLESRLTALFGLTPAEARVACEVGKGLNPKDVAQQLQILQSTVRTHLHHVFAKTATRRQAELMRLIAQIAIARND